MRSSFPFLDLAFHRHQNANQPGSFLILLSIAPQPSDLPQEWEQQFALPSSDKDDVDFTRAPTVLYFNTNFGSMQASDPRPPPETEDPLPSGWRKGFDVDGVSFVFL